MEIEEEWPLATLPRRIAAAVIDALILAVPYALMSMLHFALAWLVVPLYGAVLESSAHRATFGKRLCGLEVRPAEGGRLTFMAALTRNVVKYAGPFLSLATFGLSLAAVAAPLARSKRRQALHDLAAGSLVRRAPGQGLSSPVVGAVATVVPLMFVAGVLPILMNPAYEDTARKEVNRAIDATHPHRMRTAEFYAKNARLPESLEEIGLAPLSPAIATLSFRQGRMRIELPRHLSRDRQEMTFTPVTSGTQLTWHCTTVGMRKERVPAICRGD
jgi:uncharacterized RDD family membrane protein YckC